MKTIEERAKLRSEYYDEDDGYSAGVYVGYIDGATDQKDIDIKKACEWLRSRNVLTEASIEGFRKVMEEEL